MPEQGPLLTRLRGQAPLVWDLGVWTTTNTMQNHGTDGHGEWQRAELWEKCNWPAPASAFYP